MSSEEGSCELTTSTPSPPPAVAPLFEANSETTRPHDHVTILHFPKHVCTWAQRQNHQQEENRALREREGRERTMRFIRKFFLQGQQYDAVQTDEESEMEQNDGGADQRIAQFLERHRKAIGFLIPCLFMQLVWWTLAIRYNFFRLYATHYELPLTMIFGATVAGMTSEGGGAIAFPVMTLMLKINPMVARDFSLMVQSCGMTSAAFTILWMRIRVEWHSIVICTLGSTGGIIFGLEFVDSLLTGPEKKMLFVSIWLSFAISLFVLNTQHKRKTFASIVRFNWWKALVLYVTGFFGGLCSAFAGSGVDICSFSILTLLFRVSEKVATPTSVILMAANTCVGFFWRHLIMREVSDLAWNYFACSVPIVVVCAPIGSLLASHFHRLVLASFIYVLEVLAVIGFLCTKPQLYLVIIGCFIVLTSFAFFLFISYLGKRIHGLEEGRKRTSLPFATKHTLSNAGIGDINKQGTTTHNTHRRSPLE